MLGGYHILNNILVDSSSLHQITHRDRNKKVPRHHCVENKDFYLIIVKTLLNI